MIKDRLPILEDDGLDTPLVGEWAYKKYLRVWMYDQMFSTGMKNQPPRVYIDLFAGAGRARLRDSNRVVPSSALLALEVRDLFDQYIYCEADPTRMEALQSRVHAMNPSARVDFVNGDVNEIVNLILPLIPPRALSFCFVDPYGINIRLDTIRKLSQGRRMDFLILLAVQMDANRNRALYTAENSRKLDDFLGTAAWREEWDEAQRHGKDFRAFLLGQYARAMKRIGYEETTLPEMYEMRTEVRKLSIYYLAFFSKHMQGKKFWKEVLKYNEPQLSWDF